MRRAFNTQVRRSIGQSIGRFVAVAIITALGCGFYAGLRMTSPDMKLAGDIYCDGTNTADLRVGTTMGLDEAQVDLLRNVEGIEAVSPEREVDAMAQVGPNRCSVRVHGTDMATAAAAEETGGYLVESDDETYMNRLVLVEGEWPDEPGECLLSADAVLKEEVAIGDKVVITELAGDTEVDDMLDQTEYTVTGFCRTAYYICSSNMGVTTLGDGSVDDFMYIDDADFSQDAPYTGAFITVAGARELNCTSDEYDELVDEVAGRIDGMAPELTQSRLDTIKADAQAELDDAYDEYLEERADAEAKLDDAKAELDAAAAKLASARAELASGAAQMASGRAELEEGAEKVAQGQEELDAQRADAEAQFAEAQAQIDAGREEIAPGVANLDAIEQGAAQAAQGAALLQSKADELTAVIASLPPDDPSIPALTAQRDALLAQAQGYATQAEQLKAQADGIKAGVAALDAAQEQLDAKRAEAEEQMAAAQAQLDTAAEQVEQGEAELAAAQAELDSGAAQLAAGEAQYADGLAEYRDGVAQAEQEFADAEQKLADAQADIDALELPEFFAIDRSKIIGIASYNSDADRMDNIARVFPLFFFLVAALVSLTTMTRMVDEERILIGTYKALGYSTPRIISKYLLYAFIASLVGCLVGIIGLTQFLPRFIMMAYSIIYVCPVTPSPIHPGMALMSGGIGMAITLIATAAASAKTLRENPAQLMLPRAPKAGKRILLEHVKPLWSRMSFSWKVTSRNIFRYKGRFLMCIVGIAGCTALLLTGFGLNNAINDIIDIQWGQIYNFNLVLKTDSDAEQSERDEVFALLDQSDAASDWIALDTENMIARTDGSGDSLVEFSCPSDPESFPSFITLRDRVSKDPVALDDGGVVISEKLATELGIGVGDTFRVYDLNTVGDATGSGYEVRVGGIMENYVLKYVYITPTYYEQVMGEEPVFDSVIARTTDDADKRDELSDSLAQLPCVDTVGYNDETIDSYRVMLKSVNAVVIVLIVAAALLAFVVLYNLTNINISEREREIATLKVLGFNPRETNAYIFRETIILAVIGGIVGCFLGVAMEKFVIVSAEVDQVMFGRTIHPSSFAIALALTLVFSAVVMLAMRRKLRRVDMVESLKSID